jgi:hypothetical protein
MFFRIITFFIVFLLFSFKAEGVKPIIVLNEFKQNESKKFECGLKQVVIPLGYIQQPNLTHHVELSKRGKLGPGFVDFYLPNFTSQDHKITHSLRVVSHVNQSFQKIYILHQVFRI